MRALFLILSLLFISHIVYCQQDTANVDISVLGRSEAHFKNSYVFFHINGRNEVAIEGAYIDGKKTGIWYFRNGDKIAYVETYKDGKKYGAAYRNNINGILERREIYVDDTVFSGHCFNEKGEEIPYFELPFNYVERMPQPSYNWQRFLRKNIRKPENCPKGEVTVKFVVNKDGSLSDVAVVRSLNAACDEEAKRLVMSMPAWQPGESAGRKVRVYFSIPISFGI